tara:strand:- start:126 stop:323 length:198 start_codon:yes stop_codon:yes gene_type:complete
MNNIKNEFLAKATSNEILDIVELIDNVSNAGLLTEVIYTALNLMKSSKNLSPLLCLQIAAEDWDC